MIILERIRRVVVANEEAMMMIHFPRIRGVSQSTASLYDFLEHLDRR